MVHTALAGLVLSTFGSLENCRSLRHAAAGAAGRTRLRPWKASVMLLDRSPTRSGKHFFRGYNEPVAAAAAAVVAADNSGDVSNEHLAQLAAPGAVAVVDE